MKTIAFNPRLLTIVLVIFSYADARGIKFKAPKPPKPHIPSVSIPKPKIPVIVPVPIILPVGGFGSDYYFNRNHYINRNSRLQCYSCEGSDNDLCAISPATSSRKVTCAEKNMFCSVVRKEIPIDAVTVSNVTSPTMTNQTVLVSIDSQSSTVSPSSTSELFPGKTPTTEGSISSSSVDSLITDTSVANGTIELDDGGNSTSLSRSTRTTAVRVVIQRGCKSLDFIEGVLLSATTRKNSNESEYVNAQLCTTNLCNSGDGRLRCYECTGMGQNDSCMVKPSTSAKVLMCQPKEACYVERKTVTSNSSSTNSTEVEITVSRGCRAASRTDDQNVISRNDGKLEMSCRLSDFCNSFDANRLKRSNSASGNHAKFSSLVVIFLVIHFLIQKKNMLF
ncbi:uncharacterized protein LOC116936281 [Daphnia magna]|uniref:UPAR/Ly6 domain-containing protein n=2 Tax=Daphnia magna TaxID=35525 RepID=A0A0P5S8H5_9CRUS|nr:uncharacterized protein LOC116936281 [Daphnia magna]XP_045035507.1 uncharacterized protein LOC116936281 [Daphnia magna]XP_045035508.1 uncharacterized protein LOC116936281 [Daphnia magna]